MEQAVIFIFGAINYMAIEILWRGYTHWSMALVGGFCGMMIYVFTGKFLNKNMFVKSFAGAIIITITEFLTGIIINVVLKWDVWDYSAVRFNILGQVCLLYSFLWFLVSIGLIYVCDTVKKLTKFLI